MGRRSSTSRAKARKPPKTNNLFDPLKTPEPPSDRELSEDSDQELSSQKPLHPCGHLNADGTVYGGGPLDIHCGACSAAGFPSDYGHGHRRNQRSFCPVLQKLSYKDAAAKQLSPKLFFFEVCVYLMESPSNRCCLALRVFAS